MTMMNPWSNRSAEEQSLFNPAFCALLLRTACKNYPGDVPQSKPLPLPLAFFILPIVLNQPLRESLPTLRTGITSWAASNPEQTAGFGDRASEMADVTREAIQFGCAQQWLNISGAGLSVGLAKLRSDPPKLSSNTDDVRACYSAAKFLGRWFPPETAPATLMSLFGVAP